MVNKHKLLLFSGVCLALLFITSCRKDKLIENPNAKVSFSNDTVIFDTVFTTVGSATRYFKVYNNNRQKINISRIYIAGAAANMFRMNVDGIPTRDIKDVEIEAGDSLWIFVEVTVDPNNGTTPLLVTDSIIFITNGNVQDVDLVAWGQDAYFHTPPNGAGSPFFSLPCNDIWQNDKPHVVYGFAVVDSNCNLTIQPGTKVHFHPNSSLVIFNTGTLSAVGNQNNRITFKGDRLGAYYDTLPGQWSGIIFLDAGTSTIDFCDIRCASVGIRVQNTNISNMNTINIHHTKIEHISNFGIWNYKIGAINATNCQVNNCGQYCFINVAAGNVNLNHCTFANYWFYETRQTPAAGIANYYEENQVAYVGDFTITANNCIFYGANDAEFITDFITGATLNYNFNNCIIKTTQSVSDINHYQSILSAYPQFVDVSKQDYKLKSSSPAIGQANNFGSISDDLEGTARDANPDIGCFEWQ